MTVWVVWATMGYGSKIIKKVFKTKDRAEAYTKECNENAKGTSWRYAYAPYMIEE